MGDPVDYDKLAAEHGGAAVVDYDALAAQHGGKPVGFQAALAGAEGIGPTPWYNQGVGGLVGMSGRGPSVRDAINTIPAVAGAVGGVLGAGTGAFTGLGLGAAPGAVGGAAIGGEGGEAVRQLALRAIGAHAPETSGEAATQIGQEGGIQAASEIAGRLIPAGAGKMAEKFLAAPEKQYAQALGATTVANKELSAKIVPQLIDRRVTGSREAIKELAEKQIGEHGAALSDALAKVPAGTAADTGAVLNQLQALKKQYVVPSSTPGVNTIVDQGAYDSLGKMQTLVASTKPTFESVRRLRQILDGMVTAGDKTFGRTIAEGSELDATREASNAIRAELAKASPDVAKINKEYSFWKSVDRVVGSTLKRTASQAEPLGQQIAKGAALPAVVAGTVAGGTGGGAAAGTAAMVALRRLVQSPEWKTFSAVQKDRLADALARGDAQKVGAFVSHGLAGVGEAVRNAQDDQP